MTLTRDDIQNMPAGPEMNRYIGAHVMEWGLCKDEGLMPRWMSDADTIERWEPEWNPSTDIEDAMEALDAALRFFRGDGVRRTIGWSVSLMPNVCRITAQVFYGETGGAGSMQLPWLADDGDEPVWGDVSAETFALAACRAALVASLRKD